MCCCWRTWREKNTLRKISNLSASYGSADLAWWSARTFSLKCQEAFQPLAGGTKCTITPNMTFLKPVLLLWFKNVGHEGFFELIVPSFFFLMSLLWTWNKLREDGGKQRKTTEEMRRREAGWKGWIGGNQGRIEELDVEGHREFICGETEGREEEETEEKDIITGALKRRGILGISYYSKHTVY